MSKRAFTDQMGRKVEVLFPPSRIVSIVPSQTELLFDLGLEEEVAGLTKFCVHPEKFWRSKPRVGGTKKLHPDKIAALQPDLIIGNKEENDREQIESLAKRFPVWMSDVTTLEDALAMIRSVGELTGRSAAAEKLAGRISHAFRTLDASPAALKPSCAFFIWRSPWMVAARETFIDSMLKAAGFTNAFAHKTRYPEISLEELSGHSPDVVMLSSEPYPFGEKHVQEILPHCPSAVVKLVDGEMFSWYGSRMLKAAKYFGNLQDELVFGKRKNG